ncbi:MAG: hybrid sensor histidine kinase/response regulator, partial [Myxococcota bacterium]|nr:hybrid sensor histidine kinase/response regulator [Myxococcota bacterium]
MEEAELEYGAGIAEYVARCGPADAEMMTAMHVLHIEDQTENRLLVRRVLEADGHRVSEAEDGLTGVQLAAGIQPDIILIDINIPGLNGYEVCTRLRSESRLREVPIVAITAEGVRERSIAVGFDGFIAKPIRLATFIPQLKSFIEGRRESVPEDIRSSHLVDHSRRVVDRLEGRLLELEKANERLKELERLKMEVLRNVSHELATPLTPILGYIRMMATGELGEVTDTQVKVLGHMEQSAFRLKGLIDNLLNATRFATSLAAIQPGVAHLDGVIEAVLANEARLIEAQDARLEIEFEGTLGQQPLVFDRERVIDAVGHVLNNALKFSPVGSTIAIKVTVNAATIGDGRCWSLA